jgi:hypothetical protein
MLYYKQVSIVKGRIIMNRHYILMDMLEELNKEDFLFVLF